MTDFDPMDPSAFGGVPDVCGSCIAWRANSAPQASDEKAMGVCKLRPEIGRVPGDLPKCPKYMRRGGFTYDPEKHNKPTRRRNKTLSVVRRGKDGDLVPTTTPRTVRVAEAPPRAPVPKDIDLGDLTSLPVARQALVEMLRDELGRSRREIAPKFKGGKVEVHDEAGLVRTIDAARFLAMLNRFQAALDELERAGGADAKDVVSKIRGTFTTFNVLYQDKEDFFKSK